MNTSVSNVSPSATAAPWTAVCSLDDILPNTGVCARVDDRQVAIFRVGTDQIYAIDNVDPKSGASVLCRGLIGSLGEHLVVASPLYKNHIDLRTGECLESPEWSVRTYPVRADAGQVWVSTGAGTTLA
jgi:nitrite reductase (NADH) small subunit